MDNLTIEEEPFGQLDEAEILNADDDFITPADIFTRISEILEIALTGASAVSCILLIHVILKTRPLRTRINMYILHYAFCYFLFLLFTPTYELFVTLGLHHIINVSIICAVYTVDSISVMLVHTFALVLTIDWFIIDIVGDKKSFFETYEKLQKFIIAFIYLCNIVLYLLLVMHCFTEIRIFRSDYLVILYIIAMVLSFCVNIFNCVKKQNEQAAKFKYALIISNFAFLSWVPIFAFHLFSMFFFYTDTMYLIGYCFEFVALILLQGFPLFIAIWLAYLNPDFKKAYLEVFERFRRKNKHQNLDENEENALMENETNQEYTNPISVL